jgi:hypothetical protein|nr:MAG TPA: hypothetical protein [Bacteriophage sp.]
MKWNATLRSAQRKSYYTYGMYIKSIPTYALRFAQLPLYLFLFVMVDDLRFAIFFLSLFSSSATLRSAKRKKYYYLPIDIKSISISSASLRSAFLSC